MDKEESGGLQSARVVKELDMTDKTLHTRILTKCVVMDKYLNLFKLQFLLENINIAS